MPTKFKGIPYHLLIRQIKMRNIYLIGIQKIRKEFLRMIHIKLSEPYASVESVHRQDMEHRFEKRCSIPGQQSVQVFGRHKKLRREQIGYGARKGVCLLLFLPGCTETKGG